MTCPNIILIEKKKSTDSFVSDDPCVYEPACYEMLVGKVYYAIGRRSMVVAAGKHRYTYEFLLMNRLNGGHSDSRTNSHRTFDHSYVKSAKVAIKMVKISNYSYKNLWCTFTQMMNEKKYIKFSD